MRIRLASLLLLSVIAAACGGHTVSSLDPDSGGGGRSAWVGDADKMLTDLNPVLTQYGILGSTGSDVKGFTVTNEGEYVLTVELEPMGGPAPADAEGEMSPRAWALSVEVDKSLKGRGERVAGPVYAEAAARLDERYQRVAASQ